LVTVSVSTEILLIHPFAPQQPIISRAADLLRAGKLVAFPTETVYGLGANALDPSAVDKIYAAKGRPRNNPLIVHVASVAQARELTSRWTELAERVTAKFWPGPLTIILPKASHVPDNVTGGGPTVALRIPNHLIAHALLRTAQIPVAAPSANLSTELSPTTAEHVLTGLSGRVDLILDGGPTSGGLESTVIDLSGQYPTLLRPGLITPQELRTVLPDLKIAAHVLAAQSGTTGYQSLQQAAGDSGPFAAVKPETITKIHPLHDLPIPLASPGMLERHYSPQAVLECWRHDGWKRVQGLCEAGQRVGWLRRPESPLLRHSNLRAIEMPPEVQAYSGRLYAALHELDLQQLPFVIADIPPADESWLAVRDRLRRASTVWRDAALLPHLTS